MVSEQQEIISRRMVMRAAHLFKEYYGVWPEKIGLDYFTRIREYADKYGERYDFYHMLPVNATMFPKELFEELNYDEHVGIEIVPAWFGEAIKNACGFATGTTSGKTEVLCEGNGQTVHMSIWFTDQGYHSIIWDKYEKLATKFIR